MSHQIETPEEDDLVSPEANDEDAADDGDAASDADEDMDEEVYTRCPTLRNPPAPEIANPVSSYVVEKIMSHMVDKTVRRPTCGYKTDSNRGLGPSSV